MRLKDFKALLLVYLEGRKFRLALLRQRATKAKKVRDSECYYAQQVLVETIMNEIERLGKRP